MHINTEFKKNLREGDFTFASCDDIIHLIHIRN